MGKTEDGWWEPGTSGNLRHSGEVAVTAIREGEPFTGLAAQGEREVVAGLEAWA